MLPQSEEKPDAPLNGCEKQEPLLEAPKEVPRSAIPFHICPACSFSFSADEGWSGYCSRECANSGPIWGGVW